MRMRMRCILYCLFHFPFANVIMYDFVTPVTANKHTTYPKVWNVLKLRFYRLGQRPHPCDYMYIVWYRQCEKVTHLHMEFTHDPPQL